MDVDAPLGGDPDTTAVAQTARPALSHPVVPAQPAPARAAALSGDKKRAMVYAAKALAHAPDDARRRNLEDLISQWGVPATP